MFLPADSVSIPRWLYLMQSMKVFKSNGVAVSNKTVIIIFNLMYWFHPIINRSPNIKTTLYTGNNLYIIMVHLKLYCMILFDNRWAMISISYLQVRLVYNSILLSLLGLNIRLTLVLRLTFSFMLIKKHMDKLTNNANIAYWLVIISMCLEN